MARLDSLDLHAFRLVNVERAAHWHGVPHSMVHAGSAFCGWTVLEWAGAMAGEAGELANIAKKIRRVQQMIVSTRNEPLAELRVKVAKEAADVFAYLDLLCASQNIDLERAIVDTFNAVSMREGLPYRVGAGRDVKE